MNTFGELFWFDSQVSRHMLDPFPVGLPLPVEREEDAEHVMHISQQSSSKSIAFIPVYQYPASFKYVWECPELDGGMNDFCRKRLRVVRQFLLPPGEETFAV